MGTRIEASAVRFARFLGCGEQSGYVGVQLIPQRLIVNVHTNVHMQFACMYMCT